MYTVKKTQKNVIANIFVVFHFKEKQKKWNPVFTILQLPCKFQQNRLKKVAVGLNGINKMTDVIFSNCAFILRLEAQTRTGNPNCQKTANRTTNQKK
jgi:hypothetical protein